MDIDSSWRYTHNHDSKEFVMAYEQSLRCTDCEEWYDPSDDKQCNTCLPYWNVPVDEDGDHCYRCIDIIQGRRLHSGEGIEDALKDHARCHGWTHCGRSCCGACSICGQ